MFFIVIKKYLQRNEKVKKWFKTKNGFLLVCLTVVGSRSYVSPGTMEKSKLRSSLGRKCLCVGWFYLWKWFGHAWAKNVCLIEKKADSRLGDDIRFEKKKWMHMGVKKFVWWVEIDFKWRTNIRRKRDVYLVSEYLGKRRVSTQFFLFYSHGKCFIIFLIFLTN